MGLTIIVLSFVSLFLDFLISSSLSASNDAVASSNSIIGESFSIALAMKFFVFLLLII